MNQYFIDKGTWKERENTSPQSRLQKQVLCHIYWYFLFHIITLFYCKTCVFKTCLNQPLNKLKTYLNQPLNKLKFCVSKTSHLVRLLEIFINLTCLKQTPGLKFCSHKSHVFDIDRFHCVIENRLFGKMLNFLMHC